MVNLIGHTWPAVTHVIFMDETTMAATVGKFFLNLAFINLQCNQIDYMIHTCSQTLTAISESVLLDSQNQGFLYWFIELCVEVLQSTAQWSFLENKQTSDLKPYLLNCGSHCLVNSSFIAR